MVQEPESEENECPCFRHRSLDKRAPFLMWHRIFRNLAEENENKWKYLEDCIERSYLQVTHFFGGSNYSLVMTTIGMSTKRRLLEEIIIILRRVATEGFPLILFIDSPQIFPFESDIPAIPFMHLISTLTVRCLCAIVTLNYYCETSIGVATIPLVRPVIRTSLRIVFYPRWCLTCTAAQRCGWELHLYRIDYLIIYCVKYVSQFATHTREIVNSYVQRTCLHLFA